MDLEKLTLSGPKSHKVHIGKPNKNCPDLNIHGKDMKESRSEKYLGDLIHNSGSTKPNIAQRAAKGYGTVSQIMAILKEAPLGRWKMKAGLQMRQAMFLNGILFNSEAWQGEDIKDLSLLEKVDQSLLRKFIIGHTNVP